MLPAEAAKLITSMHQGTWAGELGLVVASADRDAVHGSVAIRPNHLQPQGIVHGGVYASIVESLASIGAAIDALQKGRNVVGLDNHTSFVRATRAGTLHAVATPITRGSHTQLWEVVIRNDDQAIAASGRVRLLVLEPEAKVAGSELPPRAELARPGEG